MKVKVFQTNNQGKIEFTRAELEKLLNEMYTEGYKDGEDIGRPQNWTTDKLTCTNDIANPSIEKKNNPMSYSINLDSGDARSLSKAVNEIIANASRGVRPSANTLSAFDALAKELNF